MCVGMWTACDTAGTMFGVDARGIERQRRVDRIVERMDRCNATAPGCFGLRLKTSMRERAGFHLVAEGVVVQRARAAQQRQRVERLDLIVLRKLLVEALHHLHVGDTAVTPLALAPQRLDRSMNPFSRGVGALAMRAAVWPQSRQDRARILAVLLRHQRMVVAERLAPVRHREVRLNLSAPA